MPQTHPLLGVDFPEWGWGVHLPEGGPGSTFSRFWGGGSDPPGGARRPCSSLAAAALRVPPVPPESVGVPGREPPLELLPEALRSRLGGVFFFAMNSAEDVSLSMSLSSDVCDSSLLSGG